MFGRIIQAVIVSFIVQGITGSIKADIKVMFYAANGVAIVAILAGHDNT